MPLKSVAGSSSSSRSCSNAMSRLKLLGRSQWKGVEGSQPFGGLSAAPKRSIAEAFTPAALDVRPLVRAGGVAQYLLAEWQCMAAGCLGSHGAGD